MSISRAVSICLCFLIGSAYAEKTANLQFLPNVPVHFNSELKLDISQSLPGLSLSTKGTQQLGADLTLINQQGDLPVSAPPFSLKFVLKSLNIDLQANDENLSFRSDEMGASLYLSQLSKLVDRPIQLQFGEGFQLNRNNEELRRVAAELPVLTEISPDHLLVELFLHLFAAGGQELYVGQVIEKDISDWEIPSLPDTITYTITEIDDYNVYADIKGDIEKKKFQLSGEVSIGDKSEPVGASLSGRMVGKIKWNRDNAMLYELNLDYSYSARFQLAYWEWLMNVSLQLHNKSKL